MVPELQPRCPLCGVHMQRWHGSWSARYTANAAEPGDWATKLIVHHCLACNTMELDATENTRIVDDACHLG